MCRRDDTPCQWPPGVVHTADRWLSRTKVQDVHDGLARVELARAADAGDRVASLVQGNKHLFARLQGTADLPVTSTTQMTDRVGWAWGQVTQTERIED